jgi:hypothetical protein
MQYTFFVAGLIGVLTGTRLRARALVVVCAGAFAGTLVTMIAGGWSVWASLGAAFGLTFTLQLFYLLGLMIVCGKNEFVRRFAALAESHENIPRRAGKTVP